MVMHDESFEHSMNVMCNTFCEAFGRHIEQQVIDEILGYDETEQQRIQAENRIMFHTFVTNRGRHLEMGKTAPQVMINKPKLIRARTSC
jgi:hypothetical protein